MQHQFDRIPDAMKTYRQFVLWRYELRDGKEKPTKVPYDVYGSMAAVDDSKSWNTFAEVVKTFEVGTFDGIGFVLTEDDPFIFIDLDKPHTPEQMERHNRIYEQFDSYTELSPSGSGYHIIVNGSIPLPGRKREQIEIYDKLRYMTMTGDVVPGRETISDHHELANYMWGEMARAARVNTVGVDMPQTIEDNVVIDMMLGAVNGDLARDLYEGRWQTHYPSSLGPSEADFALIDIISFYTDNKSQVGRIFGYSALGKREKYLKRPNLVRDMIDRGFDRKLPPLDAPGLMAQIEQMMFEHRDAADAERIDAPAANPATNPTGKASSSEASAVMPPLVGKVNGVIPVPPGLVGEIARFIFLQSPRPVENISLVAALGLMAGICGRAYNINGAGLNQYFMMLANTGTGKEAINSGISKLLNACTKAATYSTLQPSDFHGPSEIRSGMGLLRWLEKKPSFVSVLGEVGIRLKRMTSEHAPTHEKEVKQVWLDLYGKSNFGNMLQPSAYSDREKNGNAIQSPAFSLIGESTPERFYEALDEAMIYEGLLPRFTIIEYTGKRPEWNKKASFVGVPEELINKLNALIAYAFTLNTANEVHNVQMLPDAEALFDGFNEHCDHLQNSAEATEVTRNVWTRALLKAMKLASTIAVGINFENPTIDIKTAEWAIRIIADESNAIIARFNSGSIGSEIDGDNQKQVNDMMKAIYDFTMNDAAYAKKYELPELYWEHRTLTLKCLMTKTGGLASFRKDRRGSAKAIKDTIDVLVQTGVISELNSNDKKKFNNATARCFMITDIEAFNRFKPVVR